VWNKPYKVLRRQLQRSEPSSVCRHGKFNHVNLKLLVLQVVLSKFYKLQIIDIITIAVVAVFEIHIDKNIVVNMKPSMSLTMRKKNDYKLLHDIKITDTPSRASTHQ
jgi:hypothetical protein